MFGRRGDVLSPETVFDISLSTALTSVLGPCTGLERNHDARSVCGAAGRARRPPQTGVVAAIAGGDSLDSCRAGDADIAS